MRYAFHRLPRVPCPCCGYPTLTARNMYEICELCNWEDDGQDDAHADEVWGANHDYSLARARENFKKYLVMYEPDHDIRVDGPDSEVERGVKRALIGLFDRLAGAPREERSSILQEIRSHERTLRNETRRRVREYEVSCRERKSRTHDDEPPG